MKLSATIASAALAATLLVTATTASSAVVTETYDSGYDAAFLHVTNNSGSTFTSVSFSGGYAGGSTSFTNVTPGSTADFYLGDNENNFIGSQGTALVTLVTGGKTFTKSFTDVLGDPDYAVGPTNLGTIGGVPEPTSWAMLLSGFGLLGGAMRAARSTRSKAVTV